MSINSPKASAKSTSCPLEFVNIPVSGSTSNAPSGIGTPLASICCVKLTITLFGIPPHVPLWPGTVGVPPPCPSTNPPIFMMSLTVVLGPKYIGDVANAPILAAP